jgi:penicillin amidase
MLDQAGNWDEFRRALSFFDVPSQNIIYADVDGNIGYQSPGKIPIRAAGDGRLPVPGWTDEYEWKGYIPFDELPNTFDPPEGYIVTANNAVVGSDYPYFITLEWDYGYRAQRIVEMIESHPEPIDVAWMKSMQGDDMDRNAGILVPLIPEAKWAQPVLAQAFEMLKNWDGQNRMDSGGAALFAAFWKNLLADTFHDDLPEDYYPEGGSRWVEVVRDLAAQPDSPWWDDRTTKDKVETRDDIFLRAFTAAVDELENTLGQDPAKWAWGDLHTLTLRNQTLGQSGVAPIEALFNRGPYPTAGGESIVNATGWEATAEHPYEVNWLPSMRMVVDLSGLDNSVSIHTTGQSGHAYHRHYVDMADLWRDIQYHPMLWERGRIEAEAEGHLRLVP